MCDRKGVLYSYSSSSTTTTNPTHDVPGTRPISSTTARTRAHEKMICIKIRLRQLSPQITVVCGSHVALSVRVRMRYSSRSPQDHKLASDFPQLNVVMG